MKKEFAYVTNHKEKKGVTPISRTEHGSNLFSRITNTSSISNLSNRRSSNNRSILIKSYLDSEEKNKIVNRDFSRKGFYFVRELIILLIFIKKICYF